MYCKKFIAKEKMSIKRKIKDRMKKFLAEALVAGLLLVPAVLPPTGTVEESLTGELTARNEQPGDRNGDGIMPCGDVENEEAVQEIVE